MIEFICPTGASIRGCVERQRKNIKPVKRRTRLKEFIENIGKKEKQRRDKDAEEELEGIERLES